MNRFAFRLFLALLVVLSLSFQAQAYRIFVWQHDNGLTVNDPVLGGARTATQSVVVTLQNLRMDYTVSTDLPAAEELEEFDVVVVCLSFYCPG